MLETIVGVVGVLGFILSVVNLFVVLLPKRTSLSTSHCRIIQLPQKHAAVGYFLDMTFVNRSGLPISVYDFQLRLEGCEDACGTERYIEWTKRSRGNDTEQISEAAQKLVTSRYPISLFPYESQRIVLQLRPGAVSDEVFRLASGGIQPPPEAQPNEDPPQYYLVAHTSRRKQKRIPFLAEACSFDVWRQTAKNVE